MSVDVDWGAAWQEEQVGRRHADGSEYWNMRAPSYEKTAGTSPYARTFLDLARAREGETIFDMGCGSGTLALPLARAGHEVYAADFSEAMLDLMMRRAREEGTAELIHPTLLAWDDDWNVVDIPACDLAFASRSLATSDMQEALLKLDSKARRRVCATLTTGLSPRVDSTLLEAIGRKAPRYPDCVFAFNILWGLGIKPKVEYIVSERTDAFETFDAAIEKGCDVLQATSDERERLIEYSKRHLHEAERPDGKTWWEYDHNRVTSWAFLAWDK